MSDRHPWISPADRRSANPSTLRWIKRTDKHWRHVAHCPEPLEIDGRAYRRRTKRR